MDVRPAETTSSEGPWHRLSLASRYAVASGLVLGLAALAVGWVVVRVIEDGVVRNSANATALYMESFVSPIGDQLAADGALSAGALRALDELFENTPLGQRVVSFKLWAPDGTILSARDPALAGQGFALTDGLLRAFDGAIVAEFDELGDAESAGEAALGLPLLEIYSPVRGTWSGEVVAVAEFYEIGTELAGDLARARGRAWAAVAGTLGALGLLLWGIVRGGSRTIEAQRARLDAQVAELAALSARNRDLRLRVQAAASRATTESDRQLRRLGADLHDGPAQNLAFAALRLDAVRGALAEGAPRREVDAVALAVGRAMDEVRALSRGLALPDLAGRGLRGIVESAIAAHRAHHGTDVSLAVEGEPPAVLSEGARLCAYRFVQEGLTNAARHAGGAGVDVALAQRPAGYALAVRDRGPGPPFAAGPGLGLNGLRDRVESLGGRFALTPRPGGGTALEMELEEET
ncbi:sensor histidine kinase [Wenxinia saemankumensis]|uniref:histidine kinase n=1 Tax=Wenxinia saemankumensis TaxID=1447782 RepID=A0A1M6AFL9_9RHOB|nr:histidine kinase [Wenxinia saemankumensis]SHI35265.1 Signal transduction histidine kinase [Wenxinia saemankumensis]